MTTETLHDTKAGGGPGSAEQTRSGQWYRPNVDIIEKQEELLVLADMPGLGADLIDIRFEDGTLTIHGRVPARQAGEVRYLVREYGIGDFYRTFRVSEEIDASRISAEYRQGVLMLHMPKAEAVKPRTISVKAS
ncbi:MAG: Hsp20/alpha crystallin family protein [Pirellulales bacterium]